MKPARLLVAKMRRCGVISSTIVSSRVFDAHRKRLVDEALRVERPGQILLEDLHPKAVVDALQQDAAQLHVALDDQHIFRAVLLGAMAAASPPGPLPITTTS
jgi:hypothetical protein